MVSWFGQTAKDLFRHLSFNRDDLSDMKGEVFIRELTDVSILPIVHVHKMCMFLFAISFFFTILCSFEKKRTIFAMYQLCCKFQP